MEQTNRRRTRLTRTFTCHIRVIPFNGHLTGFLCTVLKTTHDEWELEFQWDLDHFIIVVLLLKLSQSLLVNRPHLSAMLLLTLLECILAIATNQELCVNPC